VVLVYIPNFQKPGAQEKLQTAQYPGLAFNEVLNLAFCVELFLAYWVMKLFAFPHTPSGSRPTNPISPPSLILPLQHSPVGLLGLIRPASYIFTPRLSEPSVNPVIGGLTAS